MDAVMSLLYPGVLGGTEITMLTHWGWNKMVVVYTRCFKMHFLVCNLFVIRFKLKIVVPSCAINSNPTFVQLISCAKGTRAIIWTIDGGVYRRIYASFDHYKVIVCCGIQHTWSILTSFLLAVRFCYKVVSPSDYINRPFSTFSGIIFSRHNVFRQNYHKFPFQCHWLGSGIPA